LAVSLSFLFASAACTYNDASKNAYQTFVGAVKDNIAQILPTVVPQEGDFRVTNDTTVNEIDSKKDLFNVLQKSMYSFVSEVYIKVENYDLFSQFWKQLEADGALHSAFEKKGIQIEYDNNSPCTMRLTFTYNSAGQILQKKVSGEDMVFPDPSVKKLYERCVTILSSITTSDMSELQKETAIHDYIVTHTEYNVSGDPDTLATADSVILYGEGQCQGYSEAMSLLLGLSGISSMVISGTASGTDQGAVAHAWNQVRINNVWYHVDVTWDDPIPDTGKNAAHTYLNRSDKFMKQNHTWSDLFQVCPVDFPTASPVGY
jgi:transglutaminase-like putative cysteine protease